MNENLDKHICERVFTNVVGQECFFCKKKFVEFDIVVTRWGHLFHANCDKPAEVKRLADIQARSKLIDPEQGHL